jgi:MFS family permease
MRIPLLDLTLFGVFAVSGFAALIYQVAWQRLLFAAFGVDIESITIVVSTFMLGLGAGALIGGWLADRFVDHRVLLFALAEYGIGLFGLFSPKLLPWAGEQFVEAPLPVIAAANFALVLVPTTFMGATLPVLVAHLVTRSGNVGVSIGSLYFSNTMGAAAGAIVAGLFAFLYLTVDQAIYVAVACNLIVGTVVLASNSGVAR